MTGNTLPDFIVIDDDKTNNMICKMIIQSAMPGASAQTFYNPEEGIAHINSACAHPGANDIILFLDINMPILNGWEVLEEFERAPVFVKQRLKIYMLSSSVAPTDKQKAADHPLVSGYIEKPLSKQQLQEIFSELIVRADQ